MTWIEQISFLGIFRSNSSQKLLFLALIFFLNSKSKKNASEVFKTSWGEKYISKGPILWFITLQLRYCTVGQPMKFWKKKLFEIVLSSSQYQLVKKIDRSRRFSISVISPIKCQLMKSRKKIKASPEQWGSQWNFEKKKGILRLLSFFITKSIG